MAAAFVEAEKVEGKEVEEVEGEDWVWFAVLEELELDESVDEADTLGAELLERLVLVFVEAFDSDILLNFY